MSSLLFSSSSCRVTTMATRRINVNTGCTIMRRTIAIAANNNFVLNCDSSRRSNIFLKAEKTISSNSPRGLRVSSILGTSKASRLKLDSNKVMSSGFPDVHGYTGLYVHDFVWNKVDKWADKTAAICSITGRSYTYGQMRKLSGRLATSLRKLRLFPGQTIAAVLPNIPEYAILIYAASEAGLRITLINPAYTALEMRNQLQDSNAELVFTVPSKYEVVSASFRKTNTKVRLPIVMIDDGSGETVDDTIKFQDLISDDVEEFEKTGEKPGTDPEDVLLLPYSSGTSGLPKGVELSHRNILANIQQMQVEGLTFAMATTASHQEIIPAILPMYHIYGLTVFIGLYMCFGAKLVCLPQFTPDNFLKVLEENRSTLLYLAPPLIQVLANHPRFQQKHVECVRGVMSGAAPIGEEVLTRFLSRTSSNFNIVQGYGLTECSPGVSMGCDTPNISTGYLMPSTQLRIVGYESSNEGKNLGVNEVGEIYVRGPQVMKGYYRNPEATADVMEGDWFKTGDLGCFDEQGLMYIRGRLKELIKVQGHQVAPAEIEDIIQGHDKVADAAVIGVEHEKYGEIPKAFVVLKEGAQIDPKDIMDFLAHRVTKYKHLGHVQFVDKIPKSAAGKILRRELKNM